MLLSALSSATERIGLAATASTTYSEPFHVARMFASIDHLSEGRAAWNAVTSVSDGEARNFGRTEVIADAIERGLTLGELGAEYAATLSFPLVAGSPVTIADELQRWYEAGACDGFVLMPAYVPGGVTDFFEHVVPEIQRRGLFRTEYRGRTLRDHLGVDPLGSAPR